MGGLFHSLGRITGPVLRKGKWVLQSLTGSEADVIRAEFEVGRDMAHALAQEVEIDSSPATGQLLAEVGGQLAGRLTNRQREFSFRAILSPEINAFALPGGFVFVTRALLDLCGGDRNEVACILAHEMAHVVRGHAMNRIMNSTVVTIASRTGVAANVMRHRIVELGLRLLHNAYSQDQELEADAFGVRLARSAGFDPRAAAGVFRKLKEKGDALGDSELAGYFSSHPPFDLRIAELNRLLRRKAV